MSAASEYDADPGLLPKSKRDEHKRTAHRLSAPTPGKSHSALRNRSSMLPLANKQTSAVIPVELSSESHAVQYFDWTVRQLDP